MHVFGSKNEKKLQPKANNINPKIKYPKLILVHKWEHVNLTMFDPKGRFLLDSASISVGKKLRRSCLGRFRVLIQRTENETFALLNKIPAILPISTTPFPTHFKLVYQRNPSDIWIIKTRKVLMNVQILLRKQRSCQSKCSMKNPSLFSEIQREDKAFLGKFFDLSTKRFLYLLGF